nr:hypothetical protein [Mycobacterium attenuatum]
MLVIDCRQFVPGIGRGKVPLPRRISFAKIVQLPNQLAGVSRAECLAECASPSSGSRQMVGQ